MSDEKKHVCIVTPDTIGPIKNGGIGTHCYFLAGMLVRKGHAVTILYSGPFEVKDANHWRCWYGDKGINFLSLDDISPSPRQPNPDWLVENAYIIFSYLRHQRFDTIHFQDWQANGFHTIQAKRTLGEFADTKIVVTMHSNTEWIKEGMREWLGATISEAKLQWCERYCCQNADFVVSPSSHMFSWAQKNGWLLSEDREVAQLCVENGELLPVTTFVPGRIAFFGRLEERKGLILFCEALKLLSRESLAKIEKIYFVGKVGTISCGDPIDMITRVMSGLAITWELKTDLDSFAARRFLKETGSVAVIPSLLDNLPYTVIECCCDGIPIIASNVGGIPELLPPAQLFQPNAEGVAEALEKLLAENITLFGTLFDPARSENAWERITLSPVAHADNRNIGLADEKEQPLVSICVVGNPEKPDLERLLQSLLESTYVHYEIVVVDESTSSGKSLPTSDIAQRWSPRRKVRFCSMPDGEKVHSRNVAASHAGGDYLVFLDAASVVAPMMVERLLRGLLLSGVDALSCYAGIGSPQDRCAGGAVCRPVGPALEIGWAQNVFGGECFIVRREAFENISGFNVNCEPGVESYELLTRLALGGYKLEVLPEDLITSLFARGEEKTRSYLGQKSILKIYSRHLPCNLRWLTESVLPSCCFSESATAGMKIGYAIGRRLDKLVNRFLPVNGRGRRFVFKLYKKYDHLI